MPASLLQEFDKTRGDVARSVFVCKALRARADVKNIGGSNADAANY